MKMKNLYLNLVKLFIAVIVGGFLGAKLLPSGQPLLILLFFILCYVIGYGLYKLE